MPEVTVIVPLYNKAPHIRRCLDSLCGQTLEDIRIIVIDDGSTDGSMATVSDMAMGDSRIQLIEQAHAGPSAARNTGLAAATGEFIGFVDADDWVELRMFELLHSSALQHDCAGARCGYSLERESPATGRIIPLRRALRASPAAGGAGTQVVRGAELYRRLFAGPDISLMTACAGIYRRGTLVSSSIHFDDRLRHTEDALFNSEFYSLDLPIVVSSEPLYHYLQSDRSLSKRHDSDLYYSVDRLYECVTALEDSADPMRRETARRGHAAFTQYVCWYYTIAVADELNALDSDSGGFAKRARRILEHSLMSVAFERAEREGRLHLIPSIVWGLMRKSRYGQLAVVLRVFNTARAFRRPV